MITNAQIAFAILTAGVLGLSLWLWYRARPGSADAFYSGVVVLLTAARLIGTVPQLVWPAASGIGIAALVAGAILILVAVVALIRRKRVAGGPGR